LLISTFCTIINKYGDVCMENEIIIRDMSFCYDKNVIFENLDLDIKKGSFVSIIGKNGSGKSTLAKILGGILSHKGYININKTVLDKKNLRNLRKKMGFVLDGNKFCFIGETVLDDIIYTMENMGYTKKRIKTRLNYINELFDLEKYLELSPLKLTRSKQALVSLAASLAHHPVIIILDEAFVNMDEVDKKRAYKVLQRLNKEENLTIINITNVMNETLYSDDIVVLDAGKLVISDTKENVYKEEKKLIKLGFELPFMVDLSKKLSYYDLTKETIYDMKEMVNHLWK
jgi:ABC-type cobalt transport system, ATPase component